jgi:hypothetical protein
MDMKRYERAAQKILDVFSDGRITNHDMMYVAFYTVANAYPTLVLDRIIEYTEHIKVEIERQEKYNGFIQDSLF